ncbi:MAG: hypothetical protein J6Z23_05220 [Lachnospiraceae bacterium]|nr:hypothetical protein [Lachnospiraceae bacterium]
MSNRQEKNVKNRFDLLTAGLFGLVLLAGFVIGCFLLGMRPKESALEKRTLNEFPKFSLESFLDGSYTEQISTWFADTFPFREQLVLANQNIQMAYGIRKDAIHYQGNGDEIPDLETFETFERQTRPPKSSGEPGMSGDPSSASEGQPTEPVPTEPTTPTNPYEYVDGEDLYAHNPIRAGLVNFLDLRGYCVYGFNLGGANIYAELVAKVEEAFDGDIHVMELLIPNNAAIILDDSVKAEWKLMDERKALSYYYGKTLQNNPYVHTIDIYDTLYAHRNEYIYFKTDHHWTQLGAYYAYVKFCEENGITPHALSEYKTEVTPHFLGSYYTSGEEGSLSLQANPDEVIAYIPITTNIMSFYEKDSKTMWRDRKIVRNMSFASDSLKYLGFIWGDNPYSYIENPEIHNGKKIMVIKDSFGNAFVPFLADHYEKVIIIDFRSYRKTMMGSFVEFARNEGVTDFLFLNNLDAISDVGLMRELMEKCQ